MSILARSILPVAGIALMLLSGCATAPETIAVDPAYKTTGVQDRVVQNGVALSWPGSTIETVFTGQQLSATLIDTGETWLDVEINGVNKVINLRPGRLSYRLIDAEEDTYHVRLALRTERPYSSMIFEGFDAGETGTLSAPAKSDLQMLIIGDDVATGYGVEGSDQTCRYSRETQNATLSFGSLAARKLGADATIIARSGRGLTRNWNNDTAATLERLYTDIMSDPESALDPDQDIVVALLGMIDFSETDPGAEFDEAYLAFLERLRADQPSAMIYAAWGPMARAEIYEAGKAAVIGAVEMRRATGDRKTAFIEFANTPDGQLYGCDWHPSADTQRFMSETLSARIADDLDLDVLE